MVEDVGQLISDYERSVRSLNRSIGRKDTSDYQVRQLDGAVTTAFDELVEAKMQTTEDLNSHVDYLLKLIKATHPQDTILQRLVDSVWRDIVLLQARRND
jgi:hypothetical protein